MNGPIDNDENLASSKTKHRRYLIQNESANWPYPVWDQITKIDTLFLTKMS